MSKCRENGIDRLRKENAHRRPLSVGSLRIDDFRTTAPLGQLMFPRRRPVEIWIYEPQ